MSNAIQIATDFIKRWEGCRLRVYQDQVGVWTIGYGCTRIGSTTVTRLSPPITQEQAESLLEADVAVRAAKVAQSVTVPLTDNQMAALVSFAYNLGLYALQSSTLLKLVNEGKFSEAAREFAKWVYAGGKVSSGLVNRRKAEAELFSGEAEPAEQTADDLNAEQLAKLRA